MESPEVGKRAFKSQFSSLRIEKRILILIKNPKIYRDIENGGKHHRNSGSGGGHDTADSGHNSLNTNRSGGSTISSKHSMGPMESHFPEMAEEDEDDDVLLAPPTPVSSSTAAVIASPNGGVGPASFQHQSHKEVRWLCALIADFGGEIGLKSPISVYFIF